MTYIDELKKVKNKKYNHLEGLEFKMLDAFYQNIRSAIEEEFENEYLDVYLYKAETDDVGFGNFMVEKLITELPQDAKTYNGILYLGSEKVFYKKWKPFNERFYFTESSKKDPGKRAFHNIKELAEKLEKKLSTLGLDSVEVSIEERPYQEAQYSYKGFFSQKLVLKTRDLPEKGFLIRVRAKWTR